MSQKPLVVEDISELTKTLTEEPLSVEERGWLRDQLCPKAEFSSDAKVEDILRYWIEHESNPTREKLSELLKTLPAELPEQETEQATALSTFTGIFSMFREALSGSGKSGKALVKACKNGKRREVRDLLRRKDVKPNVTHGRWTPLLAASLMGHFDVVVDLVEAGADVQFTCTGKAAQPALNAACEQGHYKIAEYLLDHGASVNAKSGELETALHRAAFQGHPEVVDLLLKRGAVIDPKSDDGSTPLMVASAGGNVEVIKLLIDREANASIRIPKWGRTPLHNAASRGHTTVLELLLQSPYSNIDDQDQMGNTLLMLAIRRPIYRDISKNLAILLETVRFLIKEGANLNIQEGTGKTALIFAAKMERLDHSKALIEAGADVDIQDEEKGWSAIFYAVENGDLHMAEQLCQAGANLSLLDKKKKSVYDIAKSYSPTIHKMLLNLPKKESKGADRGSCDEGEGKDNDQPASVTRQDKDLSIPPMPSYCKTDERYPGILFFDLPWKQTVTSDGAHITEWGQEIGIEFDIPPGAVPKGKKIELSVWPCISGPFQFPEGYDPASPVYLISPSFEFSCEITLKMYHFYVFETEEDCESMAFLAATATLPKGERRPQYHFRVLERSVFKPSEEYGRVFLKHFCLKTIRKRKRSSQAPSTKRQKDGKEYVIQVYTERNFERLAFFSAFLKAPLYFKMLKRSVEENFPDRHFYSTYKESIKILEDKVELNWLAEEWAVIPDRDPCQLPKTEIDDVDDDDESFLYPPMIKLEVSPRQLNPIKVNVLGISEDRRFILNPKLQPMPCQFPAPGHVSAGLVYGAQPPMFQPMLSPPLVPQPTEGYRSRQQSLQSSSSSSYSSPFSPPPLSPEQCVYPSGTESAVSPPQRQSHHLPSFTSLSLQGTRQEDPTHTTNKGILDSKPELGQLFKFKYRPDGGEIEEMEVIPMVATKWKIFGVSGLGLKDYKVDTRKGSDDVDSCSNMFQLFLQDGSKKFRKPKWSSVVQAMRDSGFSVYADELESALTRMI